MWRIYLLLGVVTLIAGLTPIGAAMATSELPPISLAVARFGIAGALLALTGRVLRLEYRFTRSQWGILLAMGTLCVPINQIGYLLGIHRANATHAGIAYALVPVLVYWLSLGFHRTIYQARMVIVSTLAGLGAICVVLATADSDAMIGPLSMRVLVGDLLLLLAAASWSLFLVLSQPVVQQFGALQTLTIVFLIGTLLHLPLVIVDYAFFGLSHFDPSKVTWRGWVGYGYITLITAYTNYLLWYLVIHRYDVTRSSVVTNCSFVITVLVEVAFFGQVLSGWVAVGCFLLIAAVLLSKRAPRQETPTAATERNPPHKA